MKSVMSTARPLRAQFENPAAFAEGHYNQISAPFHPASPSGACVPGPSRHDTGMLQTGQKLYLCRGWMETYNMPINIEKRVVAET